MYWFIVRLKFYSFTTNTTALLTSMIYMNTSYYFQRSIYKNKYAYFVRVGFLPERSGMGFIWDYSLKVDNVTKWMEISNQNCMFSYNF